MKLKEFIEKLSKFDQEKEIGYKTHIFYDGTLESYIEFDIYVKEENGQIIITD